MRIKTALVGMAAILIGAFLALNWRTLAVPVNFNFLVATISLPTGYLVVGLLLVVSLVFGVYMGLWQHMVLSDYRRQSRELRTQRDIADDAETSRFTALGTQMREDLARAGARFETELSALRGEVSASERSLAAMIAELDDRVHHGGRAQ